MLDKLSKEQEELMYKHRRDFIDFIVNNGKHQPKDLTLTKELRADIDWVYKKANLKQPKFVLIAKSYWEEKLMINAVFHMFKDLLNEEGRNQVRNQVENQVRSQVENQVWNQVENQVRNQVENQVRSQVWNQVWNQVRNQVENQVGSQVWSQVENQVRNQVRSQVGSQVEDQKLECVEQSFGLPWNSYWLSFYTYFRQIGIVKSPDFDRYYGLLNHGIWSIQFFEDWCIVTQLPKIIRRDNENRLHSIDGPAIEWRNGEKNYYIHGVYFESELWEQVISGLMPAKDVLKIENMEQRQAALSIISLSKLLKEVNARLVSVYMSKNNKKPIELFNIEGNRLGLDEQVINIIHYFCPSTGREYFDFVESHIKTAEEGMAWKFGLSVKEYMEGMVVET